MAKTTCIALTTGEPAGVGPDLCVQMAQHDHGAALVAIGDSDLLYNRAEALKLPLKLNEINALDVPPCRLGQLYIIPKKTNSKVQMGQLDPTNSSYVIDLLETAAKGARDKFFDAVVTAPVHKAVINQAGYQFSGHTEFFAERSRVPSVVMMLASATMRVALATTHLPLRQVADAITVEGLTTTIKILHKELQQKFGLAYPRISVAGLNPHAGESGNLGTEEQTVIIPVLDELRRQGMRLNGPLPADTVFTERHRKQADAILAMYHDQGLPVIKSHSFGDAVNITLGLPYIRTSVDHGTALELAGTGLADVSSLKAAVKMADDLVKRSNDPDAIDPSQPSRLVKPKPSTAFYELGLHEAYSASEQPLNS